MRLYHGTRADALTSILSEGLLPRGEDGPSNWGHTIESNPQTVFLTTAYAPYFAFVATRDAGDVAPAIFEIETDLVDEDDGILVPDEDALEQGTRDLKRDDPKIPGDFVLPPASMDGDIVARTRFFRERARALAPYWPGSLDALGTVGVYGSIPPEAITRVAIVREAGSLPRVALDAQVSHWNHKFCGAHYRNLTRALFGDFDAIEDTQMAWPMAAPQKMLNGEVPSGPVADAYRELIADVRCEVLSGELLEEQKMSAETLRADAGPM